ncbi:hypothetical protein [Pseudomonas sp. EpS/L25]|uniref:hypothetical protein n=1 Tax=Pseudomonas sp. EpS/L25 TaxID=1749078 RepID=UPI000744483C|nr:hypothetical protein [Pseudomonas sp. EpS/L25]KUM44835.1 hypothetical protein AR540_00035 [Pseudomonas sp. EpS/L25]
MTYKKYALDSDHPLFAQTLAAAPTFARAPLAATPAQPAGTFDGVTYYAFQSKPSLTLDINATPEYVGFAKTFDAQGPHYTAGSTLTELNLTGHFEHQLTRLDGHTRGATASDQTLDSSISKLTVSLTDTADNQFHEGDLITLDNFDGLQTFDGSKSTVGLSIDFINDYTHDVSYASQSAFLKSVTTGSGKDLVSVSTIAAPELDSVASLANSRVKAITVDSGANNDQVAAHIQQADVTINAGSGNDFVDLLFTKGVAAHNANLSGSFGHGATITLGEGRDHLTVVDPNLVNFDGSSSAAANRSLAANHVTVTDFKASDDSITFGFAVYDEKAVVTIQDATLTKATSLFAALNTVSQSTTGLVNAAVFHYGQDTYVFRDAGTEGQVDTQDSLIQLVGIHNLDDVAGTVSARERYEPGGTLGWG